jgi:predicted N-acetyltransferase YhbS
VEPVGDAPEIRDATAGELNPVQALIRRAGLRRVDPELAAMPRSIGTHGEPLSRGVVLVAKSGKRTTGAAWARNRLAGLGVGDVPVWCYETLAVDPDEHGAGLGTRLSSVLLDRARAAGVEVVYGICDPDLVAFHARAGFTGVAPGHTVILEIPGGDVPLTTDWDQAYVLIELVPPGPQRHVNVTVVKASREQVEQHYGKTRAPRR